jgi:hypothetical protein
MQPVGLKYEKSWDEAVELLVSDIFPPVALPIVIFG